jgi:hypothetical protein
LDNPPDEVAAFDWMWSCAIFELHNVESSKDFLDVDQQAREGRISEREFVKRMFTVELRAQQRMRKWYVDVYLPYAKRQNVLTHADWWGCSKWGSAELLFGNCVDTAKYPWRPYCDYYLQLQLDGLWKMHLNRRGVADLK